MRIGGMKSGEIVRRANKPGKFPRSESRDESTIEGRTGRTVQITTNESEDNRNGKAQGAK